METDFEKAKILINTLIAAKLDFSPDYAIYESVFSRAISKEIKNFEISVMTGDNEAIYYLSKIYELGLGGKGKDQYKADLLMLVGAKLGNEKCRDVIARNEAKDESLENTADKFINKIWESSDISFANAVSDVQSNASSSVDEVALLEFFSYEFA